MKSTATVFLSLLFLLTGLAGCDRGRVIDEAERRRIITGAESDDGLPDFRFSRASGGVISRQGKYFFSLWDQRASQQFGFTVYSIEFDSLLRLDSARAPRLSIGALAFEMTCVETVGPDCVRWTRSINLGLVADVLPAVDMTVSLRRGGEYRLTANLGSGSQVEANYETFDLEFSFLSFTYKTTIVKQNFTNGRPLGLLSQAWPISVGYEDLDLLLNGLVFFPISSYGLESTSVARQIINATTWQVDWTFTNASSGATQVIAYTVEKL